MQKTSKKKTSKNELVKKEINKLSLNEIKDIIKSMPIMFNNMNLKQRKIIISNIIDIIAKNEKKEGLNDGEFHFFKTVLNEIKNTYGDNE